MPTPEPSSAPGAPAPARVWRTLTVGLMALVIGFYFWTASSAGDPFEFTGPKNDYYNLLADGFRAGHLYLPLQPDPRLLDPDPRVRAQAPFPLDASLYHGHFYLYFGVTPLLLVFLPWKLATGHGVPENFAAALLATAGFLLAVALLNRIRRRHFPATGVVTWLALVAATGMCSAVPVALRHAIFYEVAVCSAFAGTMLFFYGGARALEQPAAARWWLALAGAAYAGAVGSRANLVFGGVLLPVLGWAVWRLHPPEQRSGRALAGHWLAGCLPAALGLGGLLLYNDLRFHNPFEFGLRYQLGSNPGGFPFRLSFLWHNLGVYFLSWPSFSRYFPFFSPGLEAPRPPGYWGIEQVHPQFFAVLLLVPLAAGGIALARRRGAAPVLWLAGALAAWALGNGLLIGLTGVRADRYLVDFQPEALLACGLALLALAGRPGTGGRLLRGGTIALLLFGSFYDAMASLQLEEFFKTDNPRAYARWVHCFDYPAWCVQKLFGDVSGPLRLQVVFPDAAPNTVEPLVTTGTPWFSDTLFVHYLQPGLVRFGLEHVRHGGPVGAPVPITAGRPYQLIVHMGSLYPPEGDPYFNGLGAAQRQLRRTLRVELNGATVLAAQAGFFDSSPGQVRVGDDPLWPSSLTGRFSGRILSRQREPLDVAAFAARARAQIGPVVLRVKFPRGFPGLFDPLVATGVTGSADILFVHYIDSGHLSFGVDHWGYSVLSSPPLAVDYDRPHELEIHMGSLYPPEAVVPDLLRRLLLVKLDGRVVLLEHTTFHAAGPLAIDIGLNALGASTCRMTFSGDITAVRFLGISLPGSAGGDPLAPVIARFRLPEDFSTGPEPLWAAIDRRGALLVAQLRPAGGHAVEVGLTSGTSATWSAPLDLAPGAIHELMLGTRFPSPPAGPPPGGWAEYARRRWAKGLRLYVDGQLAVTDDAVELSAAPGQRAWLAPLANATAGSPPAATAAGPVIVDLRPVDPTLAATPDDWTTRGGRLDLELLLPTGRSGQSEPLLTCGRTGRGDALFVTYVDGGHIRLGLDHWGVGAFQSPPLAVDYAAPLDLRIDWDAAHDRLAVTAAGRVVWEQPVPFYRGDGAVHVGSNPLGFSSCERYFGGEIVRVGFQPIDPHAAR